MSALADAIGTIPERPHQLILHLAKSISDPSSIRAHVKRETGVEVSLSRVTELMQRHREASRMHERKHAGIRNAEPVGMDDNIKARRCARKSNAAFLAALGRYAG